VETRKAAQSLGKRRRKSPRPRGEGDDLSLRSKQSFLLYLVGHGILPSKLKKGIVLGASTNGIGDSLRDQKFIDADRVVGRIWPVSRKRVGIRERLTKTGANRLVE